MITYDKGVLSVVMSGIEGQFMNFAINNTGDRYDREYFERFFQREKPKRNTVIVARDNGIIVGFSIWRTADTSPWFLNNSDKVAEMAEAGYDLTTLLAPIGVIVATDYRRQGIALDMMNEALADYPDAVGVASYLWDNDEFNAWFGSLLGVVNLGVMDSFGRQIQVCPV